ncbi:MAG TPA: hypothetical protein VF035_06950 [Longimicrobiales bacterium]
MRTMTGRGAMVTLLLAAAFQTASAADLTDPRWTPLLGCWTPDVAAAVEDTPAPAHVICLLPGAGEGITIATIAEGRIVSEQTVTADGGRRAVNESGCSGFETASWSADSRRVFLESDLTCSGNVERISRGVLALVSSGSYVDVQSVTVDGEHATRTVRYVAMSDDAVPAVVRGRLVNEPMAREAARMRAAAPLDYDDVVEATRVIGSGAVEGLLVARRAGFDLDARNLRALADAGVEESTIDVMVALSYPDHFEVEEESPSPRRSMIAGDGFGDDRIYGITRGSCYDEFGFSGWDSRYARCGYRSYYSPYGYDIYGWNYGSRPVVIVQPGGSADEQEKGAFVKGKGYTRKGASEGTARPRSNPATPPVTRTTGSTGVKATSTPSSSKPASTGSSSGTSTGRTAKPRGGGN